MRPSMCLAVLFSATHACEESPQVVSCPVNDRVRLIVALEVAGVGGAVSEVSPEGLQPRPHA